jgi:transglutaminase-like putative cysteine protease
MNVRVMAVLLCLLAATAFGAAKVPAWMSQLASVATPAHDEDDTAVLLRSESVLTVRDDGRLVRLDRKAYRILREGGGEDIVRVPFDDDTPIVSLHGWSIPPSGKPFEVGKKEAVDSGHQDMQNGFLFTDSRMRLLHIPAAKPGSIVGHEVEQLLAPYFRSDEWQFQSDVPVVEATYSLRLPAGWSYNASWMNWPTTAPETLASGELRWSARQLAAVPGEDRMPPWQSVAGRMIVALVPPPQSRSTAGFQNWEELGRWYLGLAQDRSAPSPAIKLKVQQLTASAATPLERIQALARYAQADIRYVAIMLGIGGFQPHAATDVFSNGFGDCKDKATLLHSMLKEIGIDSYYVLIHTNRGSVVEGTPAHNGFNHMILAIRVPDGAPFDSLPARMAHPALGNLLFFDPTNELVPLGYLSGNLQANHGLLTAPQRSELVQLPLAPIDANGISRTAKLTLDAQGTLRGDVVEQWKGDFAIDERGRFRNVDRAEDRGKALESRLARSLSVFEIEKAGVRGLADAAAPIEWRYTVEAAGYAKAAGDLLLVRPRVFGVLSSTLLETKKPRHHPIQLDVPARYTDQFDISLPEGIAVDDLPPPLQLDIGFAGYRSTVQMVDARTLRYSRTFEVREVSVPVAKADELRKLYRAIDADERVSAVLKMTRVSAPSTANTRP